MKKLNYSIFENPKSSSFDCQILNKIHTLNNDFTGLFGSTNFQFDFYEIDLLKCCKKALPYIQEGPFYTS